MFFQSGLHILRLQHILHILQLLFLLRLLWFLRLLQLPLARVDASHPLQPDAFLPRGL